MAESRQGKRDYDRDYYLAHREASVARAAARYAANREAVREAAVLLAAQKQRASLEGASRSRQSWTGPEIEIATQRDSRGRYVRTATEAAALTGRTYAAVCSIRRLTFLES